MPRAHYQISRQGCMNQDSTRGVSRDICLLETAGCGVEWASGVSVCEVLCVLGCLFHAECRHEPALPGHALTLQNKQLP